MPIHPDNRHRYPPEWPDISLEIRTVRAGNRCECTGQCGTDHRRENYEADLGHVDAVIDPEQRCRARNREPHPITGSKVVLTVAHLDHTPENVDPTNLLAACQRCHLRYDKDHHAASRRARQRPTQLG